MSVTHTRFIALVVASVAVPAFALSACSGSSSGGSATSSASSPASSSAAPTTTTSGASVIGPVILTPEQREGTVTMGRTVVFNLGDDPAAWDLVASDPSVLALVPGGTRDGATFNWGGEPVKPGKVSVVATPKAKGTPVTFIVTVIPA